MHVFSHHKNILNPSLARTANFKQSQYAYVTMRRATAKHQKQKCARRANIQNLHGTMTKTRRAIDNHHKCSRSNCNNTDKHQTLQHQCTIYNSKNPKTHAYWTLHYWTTSKYTMIMSMQRWQYSKIATRKQSHRWKKSNQTTCETPKHRANKFRKLPALETTEKMISLIRIYNEN